MQFCKNMVGLMGICLLYIRMTATHIPV